MDDTIVINAGLSEVDKDLVRYLFKLKASTLEHAEEPVGTFSVARRIIEAAIREPLVVVEKNTVFSTGIERRSAIG